MSCRRGECRTVLRRYKPVVPENDATAAAIAGYLCVVAPGSDIERARTLHQPAHEKCFIANSVNFPVECEPEIVVAAKW